jgi:cytochrome c biogenesis protein
MIGSIFGFKAYVFLPEGRSTHNVFLQGSAEPVPLGFELRCDRFDTLSFANGRIMGERSYLSVFDPEYEEPIQKSVIVNDPLTWRDITFFKANAYPMEEYFVVIRNQASGDEQAFRVPAERDVAWPGTEFSFRIDEIQSDQDGVVQQAKIHLVADASSEPSEGWVGDRKTMIIGSTAGNYEISFRQLYSSLLLATKDPGIQVFYTGCCLLLIGLAISFTLAHRRLWVRINPAGKQGAQILISGSSNKHKPAFDDFFKRLVSRIAQDKTLTSHKKKS